MYRQSWAAVPFLAALAVWQTAAAQPVQVSGAWARATAPMQQQAAVYAVLTSPGGDRLLGVACADATSAMLHGTMHQGGMVGMADLPSLALPAGQAVRLAPRGMHIMLSGLKHPLVAGTHVVLVLVFERAGRMAENVPVLPIGSSGSS